MHRDGFTLYRLSCAHVVTSSEPSSVVDQEALEALAGVAEIAEGGEAAEESQEADAVAEVPVEEEAEPENEADDAPVELEEEAVPVAKSSPGKSVVIFK